MSCFKGISPFSAEEKVDESERVSLKLSINCVAEFFIILGLYMPSLNAVLPSLYILTLLRLQNLAVGVYCYGA